MAGANKVPKYLQTDREGYVFLHEFGTVFHQREGPSVIVDPGQLSLTGNELIHEIVFDAGSSVNVAAPIVSDVLSALTLAQNNATVQVGSQWAIIVQNTDAVAHTITFPAGATYTVNPNPLVIPANSYQTLVFEVTSLTPVQNIALVQTIGGSPAGGGGVTTFNGRNGAVFPVAGDYTTDTVLTAAGMLAVEPVGTTTSAAFVDFQAGIPNASINSSGVAPQLAIPPNVWTQVAFPQGLTFPHNDTFNSAVGAWPWFSGAIANTITENLPTPAAGPGNLHKVHATGLVGIREAGAGAITLLKTEAIHLRINGNLGQVVARNSSVGTAIPEGPPAFFSVAGEFYYTTANPITLEILHTHATNIDIVNATLSLSFLSNTAP